MQTYSTNHCMDMEIFLAGERVAPGIYQQINGTRTVCLDQADYLPASLDGHVACYQRAQPTWQQMQQRPSLEFIHAVAELLETEPVSFLTESESPRQEAIPTLSNHD